MSEVAKIVLQEPAPLPAMQRIAMTPMEMLSMAVSNGSGIEVLERLMTLQERWQAGQARRAFDVAISAAKAQIKPVQKNRKVGYTSKGEKGEAGGRVDYAYEDMAEIARNVDPILAKHGLSYRYRTDQRNGTISVTTIVSHCDGHFEETTLSGAPDSSGKKNSIQAIGSTITYLQRYGLKAALGLAASLDDDAQSATTSDTITDAQVDELVALADRVGADKVRFCQFYKINSFADILASEFEAAKKALAAKGKQKALGATNAAR